MAVALLCLLLPAAGAQAATFDVTNTADSGDGSLRQAILDANAAEGADDIDATGVTGTIDLQSGLPQLSEAVDITGPGADQLTVRRDAEGEYRIFDIAQAVETTISGLTIADGSVAGNGGGIFNFGVLTLQDAVATGNHADGNGGGIYTHADIDFAGELTLQNSVIDDNNADGDGGGLYTLVGQSGILTIDSSEIADNHADGDGGGSYSPGGLRVELSASEVNGNSAGGSGGGFRCDFPGAVTATGSTIAENTAASGGGLLCQTVLEESTVIGNSATAEPIATNPGRGSGGGVYAVVGMRIEDSVITENTATADGGGIYTEDLSGTITLSEVSNNSAGRAGGGVVAGPIAGVTVIEGVVSGNTAGGTGGGIYVEQGASIIDTTISGNAATGTWDGYAAEELDGDGGGLSVGDIARVSNSTIAENTATGDGGGIWSRPHLFTVASSTVAQNAANRGSNLFHAEGGMKLTSTILADPLGDPENCGYSYDFEFDFSQGYNLADDNSCGLNHSTDQSGVDALLWPLADNGGPTETMIPASASPAIDHGLAGELTTDQRGLTRPYDLLGVPNPAGGDGADVGAVELQQGEHVPSPPRPPEADTTAPKTKFKVRPKGKITSEDGPVEVRFAFYGVDDLSPASELEFECKLDRKPRQPCVSPVDRRVAVGRHTFRVWASDAAGNTDPTPARARFKVKREG